MNTTFSAKRNVAIKEYRDGDAATKQALENIFGKENLNANIKDLVKTFEDACLVLGITASDKHMTGEPDSIAFEKLKTITEALNEGWRADFTNSNQVKYIIWFNSDESGFSLYDVFGYGSSAFASSRLCFRSRDIAEYAAKQFIDLYKTYYIA